MPNRRVSLILIGHCLLFLHLALPAQSAADAVVVPTPQTVCNGFAFDLAPEYPTGSRPMGVAAADLDGDGLVDIATSNGTGGNSFGFSVLKGLGSGLFASKVDFVTPWVAAPERIYLHDLNNDGKVDVVLPYWGDSTFAVFRNTSVGGSFSFAEPIHFGGKVSGRIWSMAFADFDGDGNVDAAAADPEKISIFRNTSSQAGPISFAPRIDLASLANMFRSIVAADFDGDGRSDIITTNRVLRNTGSGPGEISFAISTFQSAVHLAVADFDGDGKIDLSGYDGSDRVFVMRNQSSPGNISLAARQIYDTGPSPYDLFAVDIDGDNRIDILTLNQGANSVSVLRNLSSNAGSVDFEPRMHDFGTGYFPYRMSVTDVDRDQKPDILTANLEVSSVSVIINQSSVGAFDFKTRRDYPTASRATISNVAAADLDRDGDLDIAVSYYRQNIYAYSVYRNDGMGRFPIRTDINPNVGILRYVEVGDFDSDGYSDVVIGVPGGLLFYRNVSTGPGDLDLELASSLLIPAEVVRIHLLDIDANGKKDVIATYSRNAEIQAGAKVLRNDSTGVGDIRFTEVAIMPLTDGFSGPYPLATGDFNLDGRDDLAYAISNGNPGYIRFQLSNGSGFTIQDVENTGGAIFGPLSSGDIDQDGRPDLLSTDDNRHGADLFYIRNAGIAGSLSFEPPVRFPEVFIDPKFAADFDLNGTIDILGPQVYASTVAILGDPIFGSANSILSQPSAYAANRSTSPSYSSFVIGDFDNDQRPDLATGFAANRNGAVSVLLNRPCIELSTTPVAVSGRVTSPDGRGVRGAKVLIRDGLGNTRSTTTSSLGYYSFDDTIPGQVHISVNTKRYRYESRSILISRETTNVDFVGLE